MPDEKTRELEEKLGHLFGDPSLLLQAITHKSYSNENRAEARPHNERLEFLGDTVLDFLISDLLMNICPDSPEGELSKLRSALVSETNLSRVARELGIGSYLLLGKGEEQTGGRDKSSLLANALEAVIAALYMDGGLDAAYGFIRRRFEADIREMAGSDRTFDSKTELQEYCQSSFGELPSYAVVSETGPDHLKVFEVEITASGRPLARGTGRSKKEAEQNAAMRALESLKGGSS